MLFSAQEEFQASLHLHLQLSEVEILQCSGINHADTSLNISREFSADDIDDKLSELLKITLGLIVQNLSKDFEFEVSSLKSMMILKR